MPKLLYKIKIGLATVVATCCLYLAQSLQQIQMSASQARPGLRELGKQGTGNGYLPEVKEWHLQQ